MILETLQETGSVWSRLGTAEFWTTELWTAAFWNQDVVKSSRLPLWLLCVGLCGQAFFFSRFLVQWMVSEKQKKSAGRLPSRFSTSTTSLRSAFLFGRLRWRIALRWLSGNFTRPVMRT